MISCARFMFSALNSNGIWQNNEYQVKNDYANKYLWVIVLCVPVLQFQVSDAKVSVRWRYSR